MSYGNYSNEGNPLTASEPKSSYGNADENPLHLVSKARAGVKMESLSSLLELLNLSLSEGAYILNCSLRTLQRHKKDDFLDTSASAKILKLYTLNSSGLETFGSQEAFNKWLKSPILSLENAKPFELLDTLYGFEILTQVLGRIRHGIFA